MFLDLCKNRRSIRKYSDRDISDEDIRYILDCALTSPTAKNLDTKQFVVVRDRKILEELAEFKSFGAAFIKDAPAAIAVFTDSELAPETYHQDACITAAFIQLAAEDRGISSCWANVRDSKDKKGEFGYNVIKRLLNAPEKYNPECVIALGYRNEEPAAKKEADFSGHVHLNKF